MHFFGFERQNGFYFPHDCSVFVAETWTMLYISIRPLIFFCLLFKKKRPKKLLLVARANSNRTVNGNTALLGFKGHELLFVAHNYTKHAFCSINVFQSRTVAKFDLNNEKNVNICQLAGRLCVE